MDVGHGALLHIDARAGARLRAARPDPDSAAHLARRYRALGDPTRLTLALALATTDVQELCVCDLSWVAQRPQNLVSHHMQVLRREGIAAARRDGKMTMYRLTPDGRRLLAGSGGEAASEPATARRAR